MKNLKIFLVLSFFLNLDALKHGDSFYLKLEGQEKYVTADIETFVFSPSDYQFLTSNIILTDKKQAASRWTVRIKDGSLGQEIGVNAPTECLLNNSTTGGRMTSWYNDLWFPGGTKPFSDAPIFAYSVSDSVDRYAFFGEWNPVRGGRWHQPYIDIKVDGNFMTMMASSTQVPHQGYPRAPYPIVYRADLNTIRNIEDKADSRVPTKFELVDIVEASTTSDAKRKISDTLGLRGFKTLPYRGFRVFVFDDANSVEHIFTLNCPVKGEGYSGYLYKYSEAEQAFKFVGQSSPFLHKGGDSWFPKEFLISDLDVAADGRMLCSGGFNEGGITGGRFTRLPVQSGLFLPIQTKISELVFSRPANFGKWLSGIFGERFKLLPQNGGPYVFYVNARNSDAGAAQTFAGQIVAPPALETYTPSAFIEAASTLAPIQQTANKVYRDIKFGPGEILYALKAAPPVDQNMLMFDGRVWKFLATPVVPLRLNTDSGLNPYILSNQGELYVYQNNAWSKIEWNAAQVLNNNPVKRFAVSGIPSALQVVVVSNSGEVAVGSGNSSNIILKSLNIPGTDQKISGVIDAHISKSGKIILSVKDEDLNDNGQIWIGSLAVASNDAGAIAEAQARSGATNL